MRYFIFGYIPINLIKNTKHLIWRKMHYSLFCIFKK